MTGRRLRVALVTSWVSRNGGGVSEAVALLADGLRLAGEVEPTVFGLKDEFSERDRGLFGHVEVRAFPHFGPRSFGFSPGLYRCVLNAEIDILHLHGIWMWPSIVGAAWSRETGLPYIVSPHGMLEPWITGRNRWKKTIARLAYENRSLNQADMIHALNREEASSIAHAVPGQRILQVPNGVRLGKTRGRSSTKRTESPYICYLGRIHPKKNLEGLLAAWHQARDVIRSRNFRLLIGGWGEDEYVQSIISRIASIKHEAPVEFIGPTYGEQKLRLLSEARYLILPSFSEGLPMSILEAWSSGTPTLMTSACNLHEGFKAGAAIEIGASPETIVPVLTEALTESLPDWHRRSQNAVNLVQKQFSSESVALRWNEIYYTLAETGRGKASQQTSRLSKSNAL
jgi:glycosyltransferase involved in cell wall biosynthesis